MLKVIEPQNYETMNYLTLLDGTTNNYGNYPDLKAVLRGPGVKVPDNKTLMVGRFWGYIYIQEKHPRSKVQFIVPNLLLKWHGTEATVLWKSARSIGNLPYNSKRYLFWGWLYRYPFPTCKDFGSSNIIVKVQLFAGCSCDCFMWGEPLDVRWCKAFENQFGCLVVCRICQNGELYLILRIVTFIVENPNSHRRWI